MPAAPRRRAKSSGAGKSRALSELAIEAQLRGATIIQVDAALGRASGALAHSLIDRVVHESACPVIAVLDVADRRFINEAAKRGIFAYIADGHDSEEMQSAIDIVLRRFAEYHALEGAFARRAITERAKGILMERHGIDEQAAFDMLRDQARRTHRKLVDLAEAVVASLPMLPARSTPPHDGT